MNYLEKLLGAAKVAWLPLGEVFNIIAGGDKPKNNISNIETEEYKVPILSNGINEKSIYGWTNIEKIKKPSLTISARGTIGWTSYRNKPFFPIVRLIVLTPKIEVNLKYAYYFMKTIEDKYEVPLTGIPQLTKPMVEKYNIPIPCPDNPKKSLAIQTEIVRILDNFTEHLAELNKELTMRQQQYHYYRDKLLTFTTPTAAGSHPSNGGELKEQTDEQQLPFITKLLDGAEVEWLPLWSITTWDKKFNAVEKYKQPKVNKYHYYLSKDFKNLSTPKGTVKLLTTYISNEYTSEELAGDHISEGEIIAIPWGGNAVIQYYKGKFITTDNRIATSNDKSKLSNKYLYYYLLKKINTIKSFYRGSGIKHPNMSSVLDMTIPIPCPDNREKSLAIQTEIVRILDKFDTLANSISEGLPKEIELRQKQYQYYRDLLLDFPKP